MVLVPQAHLNSHSHQSDRNEEYYLEDVIFQVDDQLFKVNRYLFVRLSPVFRDMFEDSKPDGSSDDHPLVLDNIQEKDFVQLLKCLYPLQFQGTSDHAVFSLEEWQAVLKLSSLYEMAEVKTFAIEKMTPLLTESPSLQIHLAKTYDIRKWLVPGLLGLARRDKALDEEDVNLVGLSDALKICALREGKRRCETCASCGRGVPSGGFDLEDIQRAFGICDADPSRSLSSPICTCPPAVLPPKYSSKDCGNNIGNDSDIFRALWLEATHAGR
ncbi:hypothetical protein APHAL10511_005120 [Amanita phalloides]|nr:hypothetical protein APHAL10511_005120 [Amanita phalloides]